MSLEQYNAKYKELKDAVKAFEKSLPSHFYIGEDGVVQENHKVVISEVKIDEKTYMMNENKDTKYEHMKHTIKGFEHENNEFIHDLQYIILGLSVTELGDGDIPTQIAGLNFEKLEIEKLKLERLKKSLADEESANFVDALYNLLSGVLSHGWEYDYDLLFQNEDCLLDSLKNHVDDENSIYYVAEELEKLFSEINSGEGYIYFKLNCEQNYDYNDSTEISLTIKTGTQNEFEQTKLKDYKDMELI